MTRFPQKLRYLAMFVVAFASVILDDVHLATSSMKHLFKIYNTMSFYLDLYLFCGEHT